MLGLLAAARMADGAVMPLRYVGPIASTLLVLRCFTIPPVNSFGGSRVFEWNKAAYAILAAASLFLVFVVPRLF